MIDNAVTILIESVAGVSTRVSPGSEAVNVSSGLPRVAYTLIDEERRYSDDGNDRLTLNTYQIDVFAELPSQARAIAAAIQADSPTGLEGYRGTTDSTVIERIYFQSGSVQQGIKIDGKDKPIARYLCEMFVEHRG